ncbi:uncharacterized protein LOC126886715 [Diabrotica virgifera virgifera]|uniref:Uncharacterized protein n=1 Tax=Diabrotica virgifera virgifera TaxID=50390 RepID=A0ABM5KHK9_DIAVI|nr:uncharacterized protein LOC126886715 [Diabrotica virgifera virgifera]
MEHISSSAFKSSEDTSKSGNLHFSMDYDSGYISHHHESNLDSSLDSNDKIINTMNRRPIYLSEDALLETPQVHKYSNISLEIEKEDFEETRHVFSSPFLNNSSNEISTSVASRDISYSGFETDQTNVSAEVPVCKKIVVDKASVQNTKTMYSSPDLNDIKREMIRDMHHTKNSAFNNITNTLSSEQKKKLTLVFSKDGKENFFSVKRKYPSLTPDKSINDSTGSFLLPTPKKFDNNSKIESEHESINETTSFTSSSELSESVRSESFSQGNELAESYMQESLSVILENESNFTQDISSNNVTESESVCFDYSMSESKSEKLVENVKSGIIEEGNNVRDNVTENVGLQTCEPISSEQVEQPTAEFGEPVPVDTQCEVDKSRNSPRNDLGSDSSTEFAGFDSENKLISSKGNNCSKEESDNANNESSKNENKDLSETTCSMTEDSINLITSVVTETLEHVLKDVDHSDIKDLIFKKVNEALEISKNETPSSSKSIRESPVVYKEPKSWRKLSTSTIQSVASTPDKSGTNPINSSLSPDLFSEDIVEEKSQEPSQPVVSPPREKNVVKKDYMLLRRTQNNLKGVLPPRSVTVTQFSVADMLEKLKTNKKYFWNNSTAVASKPASQSHSLLITCSEEEAKTKEFKDVLMDRCLGLHHNRSRFSEKFEDLCGRYGSRYVGAETQSSCTVFETHVTSPMKRRNIKPQWNTKSPGKRLSHLARRKITFSSANLQSGNSFLAGSRARQILVDAKKMDLLSRRKSPRKSPRKTPRKTPGKSPRIKTRTPSSSAKKKLAMRFRKVTGEIEKSSTKTSSDGSLCAKRTLFHSPDEDKKLLTRLLPSTSGSSLANEIKRSTTKRALFMSPSKSSPLKNMGFKRSPIKRLDFGHEKKRKRDDSIDGEPSKFARRDSSYSENMPLSTLADVRTLSTRTKSDLNVSQNRQIRELTTNHKKKLQLAIYEALRSQNVLPTHPQFKVFAANLGRLTKQLFLMTTTDCIGVTEKMLRIARHHVIAVVKGRSPEEIYEEFMKNKARNLKPQGYVAPEKPQTEKKEAERRPFPGKSNFNSESKVDRIRKAFNFGDDDNR